MLDVTLEGSPDASGQLVNREELDPLVAEQFWRRLDHQNLNLDVPELSGVVPTTENLAAAIENALLGAWEIGRSRRLKRVRISETDRNIFELENKTE